MCAQLLALLGSVRASRQNGVCCNPVWFLVGPLNLITWLAYRRRSPGLAKGGITSIFGEHLQQLKYKDPERYQYTLGTLSRHSYRGKRYRRIHALFDKHDWQMPLLIAAVTPTPAALTT
jgi:hypothetical protein